MAKWWGTDKPSALEVDCIIPHLNGTPLMHENGKVGARQVDSRGIADDAILGRHISGLDQFFFGIDRGAIYTLDGTSYAGLPPGAPSVGLVYTLSGELSCRTLSIAAGYTLYTNGYKVYCQTLILNGSAVVNFDGIISATPDGVLNAAGLGSVATTTSQTGNGAAGGNGGVGGALGANGGPGFAGSVIANSIGQKGGDGGVKVDSLTPHTGGAAGAAGARTAALVTADNYFSASYLFDIGNIILKGGSGGGGGGSGGGGSAGAGGGGGGGGCGGGGVFISAARVILNAWTGRISANGVRGGNGGSGAGGTGALGGAAGSGGGGGGGGYVIVIARVVTGGNLVAQSNVQALGGPAGAAGLIGGGAVAGLAGNAGSNGTVILLVMSQPAINDVGGIPEFGKPQRVLTWFRHRKNF